MIVLYLYSNAGLGLTLSKIFPTAEGPNSKPYPLFEKKNHKNIFIISFLFWPYCPRIELIDGPARADKEQHCWFSQLVSSQITALGFLFLLEMSTGRGGVQWTGLYRYPEYRKYLEELSQIPFLHHHSSIYCYEMKSSVLFIQRFWKSVGRGGGLISAWCCAVLCCVSLLGNYTDITFSRIDYNGAARKCAMLARNKWFIYNVIML